jgi:hemolysin-activating ACP:hemolysin acyltransferase
MGWFSKRGDADDRKADDRKAPAVAKAPSAPPSEPPKATPTPTPVPPPRNAPPQAAQPQQVPTAPVQPTPPQPAPARPAPAAAAPPTPDVDPVRTFAALMRIALTAPQTQRLSVTQLRALIEPALATGQFVVASNESVGGAVLWARTSADVDARLRANLDAPFDLAPDEWSGGPHAWVVAAMGDPAAARQLIDVVQKTALGRADLHARITTPDGKTAVAKFTAEMAPVG